MDEQQPLALSNARDEGDAAAARLRRLKRSIGEPRPVTPRPERWQVVRRMIDSLRELFSGWAAFREDEDVTPEQRRLRRELEARSLKAEGSLSEIEAREKRLDEDRARALAELERVQEGWRLLRQDAAPRGEFADEHAMSAILGRLQALVVESERVLADERTAQREAAQADQSWRWIVSVAFPTFEQRLTDADTTLTLPTMRRLVKDLDRRWRSAHQAWKSDMGFPAAIDELRATQRAAEMAQAKAKDSESRIEEARRQNAIELDKARLSWQAQFNEMRKQLRDRIEELENANTNLTSLNHAAEEALLPLRRQATIWQQLSEAARLDMDGLLEGTRNDAAVTEELKAALKKATEQALELRATALAAANEAAQTRAEAANEASRFQSDAAKDLAQVKANAESATTAAVAAALAGLTDAALAKGAAPARDGAIPSIDPVLEPAWQRVLDRLRLPLETASAQLRRLFATPMPDGHRALLRLSAGSLAQASDIIKVVREFLDEGLAPAATGRLETAVDAALSAWEPALARRGIVVARVIGRGLPTVSARTESLRMAAYHLLRNAYEAMPNGGSLTVKVWRDEASGEARASFSDSGPGLGSDLTRIFSPFLSAKPGHLGLGLALARRIARRGGGELEAAVRERGAMLTLRLPAEAKEAPPLG